MSTIADTLDGQKVEYLKEVAKNAVDTAKAASEARDIMGDLLALFMSRGKSKTFKITAQERAALAEKAPYTIQVRATADGGIQLKAVNNV